MKRNAKKAGSRLLPLTLFWLILALTLVYRRHSPGHAPSDVKIAYDSATQTLQVKLQSLSIPRIPKHQNVEIKKDTSFIPQINIANRTPGRSYSKQNPGCSRNSLM